LGSGATAAHHALDVVIEVRILAPQPHIKAIIAKALPDSGVKRARGVEGLFFNAATLNVENMSQSLNI
jgi:hypothetical protein